MENEKVSVVMSTYNSASFIEEQLESILHQTYTDLEIIIADDASTDNTFEILQSYAQKDSRILLFHRNENVGYNINFSDACAKATGAYITISDHDDIWEKDKIEKQVQKIKEDESIVLVHCISVRFEERSKPHLKSVNRIHFFTGNDIKSFYLYNYISGHTILFRHTLLDAALPFPPNVYYDWWLVAYACVIGRIEFVNEILVWHRMHETNATGAAKPKLFFYKQVQSILPTILKIKNIPLKDYEFGKELLEKYRHMHKNKFSLVTFWFLLKNASIIFGHKKRSFPWPSYFKHSLRYAKGSTLA